MKCIRNSLFFFSMLLAPGLGVWAASTEPAQIELSLGNGLRKCTNNLQNCLVTVSKNSTQCLATPGSIVITNTSANNVENLKVSSTAANFKYITQNNGCPSSLPKSKSCTISFYTNGSVSFLLPNVQVKGTNTQASYIDIRAKTCSTASYTVGGSVTGLNGTLTLLNNGGNATPVSANGNFTFSTPIAQGSTYNVTVGAQPANQTCIVSNGSGTIGTSNVSNVAVNCFDTTTLSVTLLSAPPAIIGVNSPGGVDLTIENTGSTTAVNVIYTLPVGWQGVQAGSCGNIEPGFANVCTLTFTATQPNLADAINFSADNVPTPVPSPFIAFRYGGGLVFSISGTSPNARAKVVAETDQGTNVTWGNNGVTGAKDPTHGQDLSMVPGSSNPDNTGTNGPGNTYLIIDVLSGANAPAANLCANYNGSGHTDWYLPAICDLSTVGNVGFTCSSENIDQNLKQLGFGNISNTYYWSSDESTLNDNLDATAMDFNVGDATALPRFADLYVRCVREIIY